MIVDIPKTNNPRIVVIGGGFAGIQLTKMLKNEDVQIVMLDKNNFHTFIPLLYQVATAGLEPDSIAFPLRKIFKGQTNFLFRMAEVFNIKPEIKCVETSIGDITYDYLVIATGSKSNFYGLKDFQANAIPMKSLVEALNLRSFILQKFEKALLTNDVKEREHLMSVVVVGGGPTGVEIAGALAELKNHILANDYPELDTRKMQIHLIELLPRLMASMSNESSEKSQLFLKQLGVNIWLDTGVKSYDGLNVCLTSGKIIQAYTVIWSAGVMGATIPGVNGNTLLKGDRIKVDSFSKVAGYENIFAIGDVAGMISDKFPDGHPMLAPVAVQQGEHLAKNILNLIHKKELQPFVYKNPGAMATVGRNRAVVDLQYFKFQGMFAWFIWVFVHLMKLVSFRNRLVVFVNWVWNYFSYDRGIRLIIKPLGK
ncbi:MAG: NAD(P)/FAD-dependent oxidoreductase [Candidatus Melainabacteria bacterium]|nr:NAD(P)/FAD-dependent oxidoreductase [Candidatus Melainabacteria bacterium]